MPVGAAKVVFFGAGVGGNYWGDGSDGAFTSDGSDTQTVLNKNGSYDGDMLVRNYTSMTISSGHTYTVDQPCRGMLIYVQGDCSIIGTLTMTAAGAFADPASAGGSDSAVVDANGLQLGFLKDGSSDTLAAPTFAGSGTAAVAAVANHPAISSDGIFLRINKLGAAGGGGGDANSSWMGRGGGSGATGATILATGGGGGGGASISRGTCNAASLSATLTIDVGTTGGAGGAANSNGAAGAVTTVTDSSKIIVQAFGGGQATGGQS